MLGLRAGGILRHLCDRRRSATGPSAVGWWTRWRGRIRWPLAATIRCGGRHRVGAGRYPRVCWRRSPRPDRRCQRSVRKAMRGRCRPCSAGRVPSAAAGAEIPSATPTERNSRKAVWMGTAASAVVVLAGIAYVATRPSAPPRRRRGVSLPRRFGSATAQVAATAPPAPRRPNRRRQQDSARGPSPGAAARARTRAGTSGSGSAIAARTRGRWRFAAVFGAAPTAEPTASRASGFAAAGQELDRLLGDLRDVDRSSMTSRVSIAPPALRSRLRRWSAAPGMAHRPLSRSGWSSRPWQRGALGINVATRCRRSMSIYTRAMDRCVTCCSPGASGSPGRSADWILHRRLAPGWSSRLPWPPARSWQRPDTERAADYLDALRRGWRAHAPCRRRSRDGDRSPGRTGGVKPPRGKAGRAVVRRNVPISSAALNWGKRCPMRNSRHCGPSAGPDRNHAARRLRAWLSGRVLALLAGVRRPPRRRRRSRPRCATAGAAGAVSRCGGECRQHGVLHRAHQPASGRSW